MLYLIIEENPLVPVGTLVELYHDDGTTCKLYMRANGRTVWLLDSRVFEIGKI